MMRRESEEGDLAEDDGHVEVRYSWIIPLFAARFDAKGALGVLQGQLVAAHAVVHAAHVVQRDGRHLLPVILVPKPNLRFH